MRSLYCDYVGDQSCSVKIPATKERNVLYLQLILKWFTREKYDDIYLSRKIKIWQSINNFDNKVFTDVH